MSEPESKRIRAIDSFINSHLGTPDLDSFLEIKHDSQSGVYVARFLSSGILDEANIQSMGEQMIRVIESSPNPKIVVDFEKVYHISSAALGTFITWNNKIKAHQGRLVFCSADKIMDVFQVTKLNRLFTIVDSLEKALALLKRNS